MKDMITKNQYFEAPCSTASIPYWKAVNISVPDNVKILHDREFSPEILGQYSDEPYFRLKHGLQNVRPISAPNGYSLCEAAIPDFAEHINKCYEGICISVSELQNYVTRAVYSPELWIAVRNDDTGEIVATGIAELDREIGEGALEWVQVSRGSRRCGLGSYIVLELLWRMRNTAKFATVSGQCSNPDKPEQLYRKCGFSGNDVWHILRKREEK